MNDRFKFRAWDIKNGCFVEENDYSISFDGVELIECVYDPSHEEFVWSGTCGDDFILMQCTGLKDKNGNLIYEGDMVKFDSDDGPVVVLWGEIDTSDWDNDRTAGDHCHGWGVEYPDHVTGEPYTDLCGLMDEEYYTEVIGNIYENPELLEGE